MRAIRLQEPKAIEDEPLVVVTVDRPIPLAHQIRLRVQLCGVCHTDLHTVEGDISLPRLPITPGHQVVAIVDAVGEQVTQHAVGDRVGVGWLFDTCGQCHYCRHGQENLCPNARFTGLHAHGGYADYMVVGEDFAYPLPETFSGPAASPLLCAGIIGYRSLLVSGIQKGGRLGLYGFGASAHLAIQVANYWDCEVYVFTRSENHRQLARDLGAVYVGGAEDEITEGLDASIIFAPAGYIVPLALRHLRPGGTLAINAIHMTPIPELMYELIYEERGIRSVTNFTRQNATEFLALAAQIPIKTEVEVFPLREANHVLRKLKRSEIRGAAALRVTDEP